MTASPLRSRIFIGTVVHARLRPRAHKLSYRVASLLLDVDEIDELDRRLRLFSRNRANVISLHDADHGDGSARSVGERARSTFAAAGLEHATARVLLLTFPRVLGTLFNPISVYYGFGTGDRLEGVLYEVDNTVGERTSYVLPAGPEVGGGYSHTCPKTMYVSPFTPAAARYGFRITLPADELLVGVHLYDEHGALLRTHLRATARPIDDRALAAMALRFPFLGLKVGGAILLEAAKLYAKGVPVVRRHTTGRYTVTHAGAGAGNSHA